MNISYSPRATRDLEAIAAYLRAVADEKIAAAIGECIERVINRVVEHPHSAPRVAERRSVRSVLVSRIRSGGVPVGLDTTDARCGATLDLPYPTLQASEFCLPRIACHQL